MGCNPWGHKELDTTEQLHFHFSLSCMGEGNGNPLQCSCLENPRDGGAWWAAVYGVAQSRIGLKQISNSSSSSSTMQDSYFKHSTSHSLTHFSVLLLKTILKTLPNNLILCHVFHRNYPGQHSFLHGIL